MVQVRFSYADVSNVTLPQKQIVKHFIAGIFANEGRNLLQLNYVFCSDEYLLKINKDYLSHDYYTDIITFDLSDTDSNYRQIIGEVYVSTDRVRENASTHSISFQKELLRVLFHGALHLCGYLDKKKSEITKMRERENHYLCLFEKRQ